MSDFHRYPGNDDVLTMLEKEGFVVIYNEFNFTYTLRRGDITIEYTVPSNPTAWFFRIRAEKNKPIEYGTTNAEISESIKTSGELLRLIKRINEM